MGTVGFRKNANPDKQTPFAKSQTANHNKANPKKSIVQLQTQQLSTPKQTNKKANSLSYPVLPTEDRLPLLDLGSCCPSFVLERESARDSEAGCTNAGATGNNGGDER
mgnify:CR=1 FL=1